MFNFLKKKAEGQFESQTATFKIDGLHCVSCSLNIDGELEDTDGVFSAQTNYAKSMTTVDYDPAKLNPQKLKAVIESLEYSVVEES